MKVVKPGDKPQAVLGRTDDLRISAVRALIAPQLLTEELPIDSASLATVWVSKSQTASSMARVLRSATDIREGMK